MLKSLTLAAVTLTALTLSPVPVITGAANAQAACTANYCRDEPNPSSYHCSDELGYLRRVHEEELEVIEDPNLVVVTPICVNDRMMRSDGNAGALRQVIASNDAMQEALFRKDSRHEDVVGIRMIGPATVILYVYPTRY